jgi:hypothetical protein
MKNYGLYTKNKEKAEEIINRIQAETLEEAIILFSKIKNISKRSILEIFEVKEIIK